MIVKNEEKILARCLDSICDLMDEMIIVDTGSEDKTKEIARKYTDKVYDFVWGKDFSEARNFSFSKATKEYIYVADADEVLDEENRKRFLQLKEVLLPEIEIVQMMYCNQLKYNTTYNFNKEYRPKLYKRVRNFFWQDPVHESVRIDPMVYDSEIEIQHLPESNHGSRDFSLFLHSINQGKRFTKKMHHMYARELFITGEEKDFVDGKEFFLDSVTDSNRDIEEIQEAICVLVKLFRMKKNIKEFFKYALKGIALGAVSEICYELGRYYQEEGELTEACLWYYNGIYEAESILNIHSSGDMAFRRLTECYEQLYQQLNRKGVTTVAEEEMKEQYRQLRDQYAREEIAWKEQRK